MRRGETTPNHTPLSPCSLAMRKATTAMVARSCLVRLQRRLINTLQASDSTNWDAVMTDAMKPLEKANKMLARKAIPGLDFDYGLDSVSASATEPTTTSQRKSSEKSVDYYPREKQMRHSSPMSTSRPARISDPPRSRLPQRVPEGPMIAYEMTPEEVNHHQPKSFAEFGLPDWLLDQLQARNVLEPTPVQTSLIAALTGKGGVKRPGKSSSSAILVKAETGTGKSFGYLVALMGMLHKEAHPGRSWQRGVWGGHHLIVVPSVILAEQLYRWIEELLSNNIYLSKKLKDIVKLMIPSSSIHNKDNNDSNNHSQVDGVVEGEEESYSKKLQVGSEGEAGFAHILIATPALALKHLTTGHLNTSKLKTVIVDEADATVKPLKKFATLKQRLNRERHPNPTMQLLTQIWDMAGEYQLALPRLVIASASLNNLTLDILRDQGLVKADAIVLRDTAKPTDELRCPPSIKHFHRMLKSADDVEELVQIITWIRTEQWEQGFARGVVFLPASQSKAAFVQCLASANVPATLLSDFVVEGDMPSDGPQLLVGSDSDARGWDLPGLNYVIMVDLPPSAASYLHMAGRVGRMGQPGSVFSLVAGDRDLHKLSAIHAKLHVRSIPYLPRY